jgi:hypothetical protein
MSAVTLNYLTTTQPNVGGTSVKVTTDTKMVSFSYIVFPGDNASSTIYTNDLLNYTVNVGSDECTLIDTDNSTYYTYSLFVCWGEVLCASDYYLVVSGLTLNGEYTPYQTTPLQLYLSPNEPVLTPENTLITRFGPEYSDATITILFEEPTCFVDYDVQYNVAIQYTNCEGNLVFITEEVTYQEDLKDGMGGVEVTINAGDGVSEDTYVAVQAIRNISLSSSETYRAIGAISNTVKATDTQKPQPPVDLSLNLYEYWTDTAYLSWLPPASACYIGVDNFFLYRKDALDAPYVKIASIPYDPSATLYEYADDTLTIPPFVSGDVVSYHVRSNNEDGESAPSNSVSLTIIEESSAPVDLYAGGLLEGVDPDISGNVFAVFKNPTDVNGEIVCDYQDAFFVVNVLDPSGELLGTNTIAYEDSSEAAYEVNITDFPVPDGTTTYNVTVEAYLVTFDAYCNEIHGQIASTTITITFSPLIWNINGNGLTPEGLTWFAAGEFPPETTAKSIEVNPEDLYALNTCTVNSYVSLIGANQLTMTLFRRKTELGGDDGVNTLKVPASYVRTATSSEPFPGSFVYQFDDLEQYQTNDGPEGRDRAIVITAGNPSEIASRSTVGSIL